MTSYNAAYRPGGDIGPMCLEHHHAIPADSRQVLPLLPADGVHLVALAYAPGSLKQHCSQLRRKLHGPKQHLALKRDPLGAAAPTLTLCGRPFSLEPSPLPTDAPICRKCVVFLVARRSFRNAVQHVKEIFTASELLDPVSREQMRGFLVAGEFQPDEPEEQDFVEIPVEVYPDEASILRAEEVDKLLLGLESMIDDYTPEQRELLKRHLLDDGFNDD